MLPTSIMMLLHLQVGLTLYIIPKCGIIKSKVPPFKGDHLNQTHANHHALISLEGELLGFHDGCL